MPRAKVANTIEFVEGVVAQGEKVIIFSGFDEPVTRMAKHFDSQCLLLTGKTPTAKRQKLVDRFHNDDSVRVFVANIVAGGVGLNLTAARQVVFNDLDWVPANHWQAEDRAYRIGQTGVVNVTYMTAEKTIDEFVSSTLRAKSLLIGSIVDGAQNEAQGSDLLTELQAFFRSMTPSIATLSDEESAEDPVDRLLREVTALVEAQSAGADTQEKRSNLRDMPVEAILALARALSGPVTNRYRAPSSSRPGAYYHLDVDATDVSCTCPSFEYRGACKHARTLKASLASGGALPDGIELALHASS